MKSRQPADRAAPTLQTPAVIHLPYLPPAEPPAAVQRRNGRLVSTKPGSQVNRRRRVPDPKDRVITFRCTSAEYELLVARAAAAGLAIGPHLRQREIGTAGPRAKRNPSEAARLLAQILGQMGKRGANLNQVARATNEIAIRAREGEATERLAARIEEITEQHRQAIAEHRGCVAAILRGLGLRPDADHY